MDNSHEFRDIVCESFRTLVTVMDWAIVLVNLDAACVLVSITTRHGGETKASGDPRLTIFVVDS